ncbi:hydantoinase/oxoprolinase family protein [Myxococcota bacterium]|nr:hydantoinase/oxoprolinase family protein [Myxococcota bacterium]
MTAPLETFLGIDVGGTFTDVVLGDDRGNVHVAKLPTTPADPLQAIDGGIRQVLETAKVSAASISRVVHGTTRATNAIVERKVARAAFVATEGFGDMLELGREARVEADRYDLHFAKPRPPIEPELCFEAPERVDAGGQIIQGLSDEQAAEIAGQVAFAAPEAVAICLLHSAANPLHEERLAAACRAALPEAFVVASSEVWPEIREYERALTTVMCAAVGPEMAAYLSGFESLIRGLGIHAPVQIMESSGGVMSAARAARIPIYTVESGGAAGVVAAGFIGQLVGESEVISFDMGGTTAKAGVVRNSRPDVTHTFHVGGVASLSGRKGGEGFPLKIPVVDIAEVGSGGGSIAWVDSGDALRVGPRSAGADPGPACYGRGGREPTVTDANLVLGYLNPARLAGGVELSPGSAHEAILRHVGTKLNLDVAAAARGIHEIANLNMAAAIRVVTIHRGIDPRHFSLIGFGGAGPMHIARLAEAFDIQSARVPAAAGVASALGLLTSNPSVDTVRTLVTDETDANCEEIETIFRKLEQRTAREFDCEPSELQMSRSIDVQYVGQAHSLNVPLESGVFGPEGVRTVARNFRDLYRKSYGIDLDRPTQFVNFRTRTTHPVETLSLRAKAALDPANGSAAAPSGERNAHFSELDGFVATPVYAWTSLEPGHTFSGPGIVEGPDTTLVVPPNWQVSFDGTLNAILQRRPRL